jgi:hypothetical protein
MVSLNITSLDINHGSHRNMEKWKGMETIITWLVASTILKNISQWEGLSHINYGK